MYTARYFTRKTVVLNREYIGIFDRRIYNSRMRPMCISLFPLDAVEEAQKQARALSDAALRGPIPCHA